MLLIIIIIILPFSRWTSVSGYQNVSILNFGAKDDGGGGSNWSCKACKISSPVVTTNKPTPSFFMGQMPLLLPN